MPKSIPILPLRNAVLFPGVVIPISATRDKSVKLIKYANSKDKLIGVVSQKDSNVSDPSIGDINKIGTVAKILRSFANARWKSNYNNTGKKRFKIENVVSKKPFLTCSIE